MAFFFYKSNNNNFRSCSLCIINFTIISNRIFVIIWVNILIKCCIYNMLVSGTCIKLEWKDTFTLRWYDVYLVVWKRTKLDSTNKENWKQLTTNCINICFLIHKLLPSPTYPFIYFSISLSLLKSNWGNVYKYQCSQLIRKVING